MASELDAAVARLKEWAETPGFIKGREVDEHAAAVRLLLGDWERRGKVEKNTASLVREADTAVGLAMKARNSAEAERDAARAEVERLDHEVHRCALRSGENYARAVAAEEELARLRERDAQVLERLQALVHSPDCDPTEDWCECGLDDVLALLKETP